MQKITQQQKLEIIELIEQKKKNLSTSAAVATFCQVSESTISRMLTNDYTTKGDEAWLQVGVKLGWKPKFDDGRKPWVIIPTKDYRTLKTIVADAKLMGLFIPISDVAGMGKTACLKSIAAEYANAHVYYLRCQDWGKKEFLLQLCQCLGIDAGKGFKTPSNLIDLIVEFFQSRSIYHPVLIIDEADKLKAGAKGTLIPIYNECEDMLGCVIAGTENLEKEIKRGVRYQTKGYDEIDSRFGRKYIKLLGCTLKEAEDICKANGLTNQKSINEIIEECKPVRKIVKSENREVGIRVITDLRRLKRLVIKELLITSKN